MVLMHVALLAQALPAMHSLISKSKQGSEMMHVVACGCGNAEKCYVSCVRVFVFMWLCACFCLYVVYSCETWAFIHMKTQKAGCVVCELSAEYMNH